MSDVAVTWAKAQTEGLNGQALSRSAGQVLTHLASYADAEGVVWALVDVLRIEMKVKAERTVQRGLAELKALGLIVPTGEMKRYNGRLIPFYQLALDHGPANTRQLLRDRREPSTGDMGVTPSDAAGVTRVSPHGGPGCHPTGDMGVTQIGKLKPQDKTHRASARESEAGSEGSEVFERVLAAWAVRAPDRVSRNRAWPEWLAALDRSGLGEEALSRASMAYLADDQASRGLVSNLHRWLAEGRYEARLMAEADRSGSATRSGLGAVWSGPLEVREAVEAAGVNVASYLDTASWDPETRTIHPATGVASERMQKAGPALKALGVTVAVRSSIPTTTHQHERAQA